MTNRILILCILLLGGCRKTETPAPVEYNGPLSEMENVDVLYSENDRIKVKMKASKIQEFKNGDREFPDGLYLEFYNQQGILSSTLKANHAFYFKEDDLWRAREKVEVVNIEKQQQLNTEELFWKRNTKRIYTDKFVTIKLENELIQGTGLDAAQDMSSYTLKKNIKADLEVKED